MTDAATLRAALDACLDAGRDPWADEELADALIEHPELGAELLRLAERLEWLQQVAPDAGAAVAAPVRAHQPATARVHPSVVDGPRTPGTRASGGPVARTPRPRPWRRAAAAVLLGLAAGAAAWVASAGQDGHLPDDPAGAASTIAAGDAPATTRAEPPAPAAGPTAAPLASHAAGERSPTAPDRPRGEVRSWSVTTSLRTPDRTLTTSRRDGHESHRLLGGDGRRLLAVTWSQP